MPRQSTALKKKVGMISAVTQVEWTKRLPSSSSDVARMNTESSLDQRMAGLDSIVESGMTLPGLGRQLMEWIQEGLGCDTCLVQLADIDRQVVGLRGYRSEMGWQLEEVEAPIGGRFGESQIGSLLMAGEDGDFGIGQCRLRAPVIHDQELLGNVEVVREREGGFSVGDWHVLLRLTRQFAFLLHMRSNLARARESAIRDDLTGLHNRRFLERSLAESLDQAKRRRQSLSLMILDVDHFKSFNDTYGHAVGDRILEQLGGLMKSLFRSDDVVCRYGGEEFAIILRDRSTRSRARSSSAPIRSVQFFAERLRQEAEKLQIEIGDGQVLSRVTISGGIAAYPDDAETAEELMLRADDALYRAKREGRNRICLSRTSY